MKQLSAHSGQSARAKTGGASTRTGWLLTVVAAVFILIAIVAVAVADGLKIAAQNQTLRPQRVDLPAREEIYPQAVVASPTVISAPQPTHDDSSAGSALVMPTVVSVPEAEVIGMAATVNTQQGDRWLRSGPGSQYAALTELLAGERVELFTRPIEVAGQWWQLVRTSDGHLGWYQTRWLSPTGEGQ
ncbi:MAG: SH3 domain-containing protein [Chloroflexota bacterium]